MIDAITNRVAKVATRLTAGYLHRPPFGGAWRPTNINTAERVASVLLGTLLVAYGWRRRFKRSGIATTGGMLLDRGLSGRCAVYRALGVTST
jgi:hypothetical protein